MIKTMKLATAKDSVILKMFLEISFISFDVGQHFHFNMSRTRSTIPIKCFIVILI